MVYTGNGWVQADTTQLVGKVVGTWWTLFLDDDRQIDDVLEVKNHFSAVKVARTVAEAIALIETEGSLPLRVSLDHDLGKDQPVAVDFVWHLINGHLDEKWDCSTIKTFYVHSANIVGSKNMLALWEGFTKEFGITCQIAKIQALEQPSS